MAIRFPSEIEFPCPATPGHTEGSVCFIESNEKTIFSGDTIFRESIGRVDLPGGSDGKL